MLEEVKGRRRFTWILLSQNAQVADVRDGVLVLAMAGVGPRDSFAKGGSEDILREALTEALGVDLRIEAIVDPSVTSGGRAGGGRGGAGPAVTDRTDPAGPASAPEPPDDPYEASPGRTTAAGAPPASGGPTSGGVPSAPGAGPAAWSEVPAVPGAPGPTASTLAGEPAASAGAPEQTGPPGVPDHREGAADGGASGGKPPVDPRWREQARQHIRPTRQGGGALGGAAEDLRDEAASINDSDVEDQEESHTELLARQLGAEIIGEEKHGY